MKHVLSHYLWLTPCGQCINSMQGHTDHSDLILLQEWTHTEFGFQIALGYILRPVSVLPVGSGEYKFKQTLRFRANRKSYTLKNYVPVTVAMYYRCYHCWQQ